MGTCLHTHSGDEHNIADLLEENRRVVVPAAVVEPLSQNLARALDAVLVLLSQIDVVDEDEHFLVCLRRQGPVAS